MLDKKILQKSIFFNREWIHQNDEGYLNYIFRKSISIMMLEIERSLISSSKVNKILLSYKLNELSKNHGSFQISPYPSYGNGRFLGRESILDLDINEMGEFEFQFKLETDNETIHYFINRDLKKERDNIIKELI